MSSRPSFEQQKSRARFHIRPSDQIVHIDDGGAVAIEYCRTCRSET